MGLALLLSVSRTFRVARDLPHRYRASARARLPNFGAVPRAENSEAAMKVETEKASGKTGQQVQAAESGPGRGMVSAPEPGGQVVAGVRPTRRWWDIPSWFAPERRVQKKPAVSAAVRGRERTLVQQELALENIKPHSVVHAAPGADQHHKRRHQRLHRRLPDRPFNRWRAFHHRPVLGAQWKDIDQIRALAPRRPA